MTRGRAMDEDLVPVGAFVRDLDAACGGPPPAPSPELAELLASGAPPRRRAGRVGTAGKVALALALTGTGVAAADVADVLPPPVEHVVREVADRVWPFEPTDGAASGRERLAAGARATAVGHGDAAGTPPPADGDDPLPDGGGVPAAGPQRADPAAGLDPVAAPGGTAAQPPGGTAGEAAVAPDGGGSDGSTSNGTGELDATAPASLPPPRSSEGPAPTPRPAVPTGADDRPPPQGSPPASTPPPPAPHDRVAVAPAGAGTPPGVAVPGAPAGRSGRGGVTASAPAGPPPAPGAATAPAGPDRHGPQPSPPGPQGILASPPH